MTTQPKKLPLLQAVSDILDDSLTLLKNHSSSGEDSIGTAEKEIKNVKKSIDDYKQAKGDEIKYVQFSEKEWDK
ncbi:hypothetical protein L2E65_21710 [Planktothrix agardhii 1801]|jgi:hypothetical protein|uniref:hypothetical protein n=1 Tax=Planktothrix agardhii TaxID=1160 RepID=UPI001F3B260E|nr:hypothetical protein [Planktothrix agardhii]MCF3627381.1 hypothetical protein [Planktothrix agardhii 1801]